MESTLTPLPSCPKNGGHLLVVHRDTVTVTVSDTIYIGLPESTTPLTMAGNGTQTTNKFRLESGLRVIRVTKSNSNESIFLTMLNGETGDWFSDGSISDIYDKSEVSKSFQVENTGAFVINVDTGGEWTVYLDSGESIPSIPSGNPIVFSGNGTQTTGKFTLASGLRIITVTKSSPSESIFVTMLDGETGDWFSDGSISDIDEKSEVSKSFQVESSELDEYVLNVDTGGEWTVTIE
jgi:hypothetical protein